MSIENIKTILETLNNQKKKKWSLIFLWNLPTARKIYFTSTTNVPNIQKKGSLILY